MSAVSTHFVPRGRNTSIVQVCSYVDKRMEGTLRCMTLEEDLRFGSLMQFLALMDAVMDLDNQPQRSVEPRVFSAPVSEVIGGARRAGKKVPPIATFQISVLFRQNASWQGTLVWKEKEREVEFRSALEMIMLVDNALGE